MIEDQIKQFISENLKDALGQFGSRGTNDAHEVMRVFTRGGWRSRDLAEMVMDNEADKDERWQSILLTECGFDGGLRTIIDEADGDAFQKICYRFLSHYALAVLVNGEDYIQSLMPKVVEFNDELEIDNACRGRDLRGAA